MNILDDQNNGNQNPSDSTTQPPPAPPEPVSEPASEAAGETTTLACATCGKVTNGYKCAVCGEESEHHDDAHACGGANCQPKCLACGQSESKCSCGPTVADTGSTTPPAV